MGSSEPQHTAAADAAAPAGGGDLQGKTAIVTGAGSGIGRATVLRLAREGARVFALDLDGDAAAKVSAEAGGAGAAEVDVADEQSVASAFATAFETLGGVPDILANIAGIGSTTTVPDTSVEIWDRVFAVDVRGVFLCCREVIPGMAERGSGTIVNMASIAGMVGLPRRAAYCAAKGAVISLTRAMAVDHVEQGLRINCICPGTVDSPWVARLLDEAGEDRSALEARQPMGRLGKPEEIADAVAYLASDRAAFITGSGLVIDGGLTAK